MKIINENAEQLFRGALPCLAVDPAGWVVLHAGLSRRLSSDDILHDLSLIREKLDAARRVAMALCRDIDRTAGLLQDVTAFLFRDSDVLIMARLPEADGASALARLHEELSAKAGCDVSVRRAYEAELYCRALLEEQRKSEQLMKAYDHMADASLRSSVPVRRGRRPERLALIVEDDYAIATWAAQILSAECDIIHVRSGEEAIASYLEYAPDIVFLNVHLPGIDGHRTLRALRKADPVAFVVMFSSDPARTHVLRACEEGASGFLCKPATGERLVSMLNRAPFVHRKDAHTTTH